LSAMTAIGLSCPDLKCWTIELRQPAEIEPKNQIGDGLRAALYATDKSRRCLIPPPGAEGGRSPRY
jgi:hypothetical protein